MTRRMPMPPGACACPACRAGGFVLVTTLWVLAIASVLVIGLGHRAFLEARAAAFALEQAQARMMAAAAVQRGMVELRNKFYKDLLMEEQGLSNATHLGQPWAQPMALHEEGGIFGPGKDAEEEAVPGNGVWLFIEDAERRININAAPEPLLEKLKPLKRGVQRAIVARRTMETHEGDGVSLFQALEELRYLRGMDDEAWFGEDGRPGLRDLLTVHGQPLININTAPRVVLEAIPNLSKAAVDAIIAYRGDEALQAQQQDPEANAAPPGKGNSALRGFADIADLEKHTDIRGDALIAIQQFCSFQSQFFIIRGVATRQGGKVRAECRAVVASGGEGAATILDWQEVNPG
jgi:hypothetical protein